MSEQRGTKEAGHGEDYVNTILFTAGTALLMTYLKRAAATMLAVEQWRIWVFLFLNLTLLAIAVSSICNNNDNSNSKSSSEQNQERHDKDLTAAKEEIESEKDKPKKREELEEQYRWFETTNQVEEKHQEGGEDCEETVIRSEDGCDVDEPPRLSKEELNERAEAFIMMFRQHLVLDAMNGRSNHKRDNIQLSKHATMHLLQVHR